MSWMCDSCIHQVDKDQCEGCNPEDPVSSNYSPKRAWGCDKYQDTAILCPFYKRSDRKFVLCEGPMERNRGSVMLKYYRGEDMSKHRHEYCELLYERCPIYQLANKKYETEG